MNPNTYSADHNADAGLVTDLPVLKTPPNVAVEMKNFHQFGHGEDGEQEILQTERGNNYVAGLPANWLVVGSEQHNGVRYFVLAEFDRDYKATGRGQVGSFPSPGPKDTIDGGYMVPVYSPLQNLIAEGQTLPGDFISPNFNFVLEPVRVEVQPDYDGTVNLILNDYGRNAPKLINTRFSVQENGRYKIVDREGERDSNVYSEANFTDTLRLFQRSRTLTKATFTGLTEGGKLLGGSYQLFFQYVNQDGNEGDVMAWTPVIPVYDGTSMATVRGTMLSTTRGLQVELANVDQSYSSVRVSFVRTTGTGAAEAVNSYRLANDVQISAPTLRVTLTGFEALLDVETASFSLRTERLETFRDMTQTDNRLVFSGLVEAVYNRDALDALARSITIGWAEKDISSVGTSDDGPTVGSGAQSPFSSYGNAVDRDGWAGGYLNPMNAAYRLGYGSGEMYAFGIVFRLADGTDSVVFPLHGHDHLRDTFPYGSNEAEDYDARGWSETGENLDGIYRFPHLCAGGRNQSYPVLSADGRYVKALGVTFKLPPIPDEVLTATVGCYFVRAQRKPDRICQGVSVAVINSLLVSPDNKPFDHDHPQAKFNETNDRMNINMKCIPGIGGVLETAVKKWDKKDNEGRRVGPFLFQFATTKAINNYRTAFYSPDIIANPEKYTALVDGQSLRYAQFCDVKYKTVEMFNFDNNTYRSFGVWKPVIYNTKVFPEQPKVRAFFTPSGMFGSNEGRFGSGEKYLVGKHRPNNNTDDRYLVQASFNSYVGLLTTTPINVQSLGLMQNTVGGGTGLEFAGGNHAAGGPHQVAWLCNLYPRYTEDDLYASFYRGARPPEVLRDVYNSSSETYFPITPLMGWDEVNEQLDDDNQLACFGGDIYLGLSYHRVQYNSVEGDVLDVAFMEAKNLQMLGICCESELNPYVRVPELQARPGETSPRSFFPYAVQAASTINALREKSFRSADTDGYNAGYGRTAGHTMQVASVRGLPFRATEYPNDLGVTTQHVAGSFRNGFRTLVRGARQTYARQLGSITGIRAWGSVIGIGFENGFGIVGVNERIATGSDSQGPLFFEARQILSPEIAIKSHQHGLFSPAAFLATDSGLYGIGPQGFWKFDAGGFLDVSANTVNKLLLPQLQQLNKSRGVQLLQREAKLEYDAARGDVLITILRNEYAPIGVEGAVGTDRYYVAPARGGVGFPAPGGGGGGLGLPSPGDEGGGLPDDDLDLPTLQPSILRYQGNNHLLLRYNERKQRWMGQGVYPAQHHFSLLDVLYSVPLPGQGRQVRPGIFAHVGNSGNFYDQSFECVLTFLVRGDGSRAQKILNNLVLTSNQVLPRRLRIKGEDSEPTEQIMRDGRVLYQNVSYSEGYVYITVKPDSEGSAQRGKTLLVSLIYGSNQRLLLEKVELLLQNSYR